MDEIEKCFREHWDEFIKKINRRCVNLADAEDVVSEAFRRAIQYRDTYNPEKQAVHVWLFTIVLNAYHDYVADLFKRGMTVPATDEHIEAYDNDFDSLTMADQIVDEIGLLSDGPAKECLSMYFVLGMTPREIASIMPVKPKFVVNHVHRFKNSVVDKLKLEELIADKERKSSRVHDEHSHRIQPELVA